MPDPVPASHEPPHPVTVRTIRRLAAALAAGRRPDLSGLTLADLRDVWRMVALLDRMREWRDEPQPEPDPDAPRLTSDEAEAFARDVLRVPTATEIVLGIFEEPLMLAALAVLQAATMALVPQPRRSWP